MDTTGSMASVLANTANNINDTTTSNILLEQNSKPASNGEGMFTGTNCCAGCREPIRDKFIFSVIDLNWHADCVQCSDCNQKLNERCHTFEGKLYCKEDYWRRFGPRCFGCSESIERSELVQRIKGNRVYHLDCFTCSDCNRQLRAGEQLHLIDGSRLLCRQDFNQLSSKLNNNSLAAASPGQLKAGQPNSKSKGFQSLAAGGQATYYTFSGEEPLQGGNAPKQSELGKEDSGGLKLELAEEELEMLEELAAADEDSSSLGDQDQDSLHFGAGQNQNANSFSPLQRPLGSASKLANSSTEDLMKAASGQMLECPDELVDANGKRRGPRTTIKPKQLETLRRAFEQTPKPQRQIREELAKETGLNMRVIQVWFQNRRSKERRMKNSNGSARRNFFRASSRRIRVVPGPQSAGSGGQQSLIAAGGQRAQTGAAKASKNQQQQQQQLSPMDSGEQLLANLNANGQPNSRQHNSPSDFGGSSSGGFTYFSDSSNQAETGFAINTPNQPQPPAQSQDQQQPGDSLMALESPSTGTGTANGNQQQQANQQRQYGHQLMKNTPPPATQQPQMFPSGPPPPQHMLMPGPPHQHPPQMHSQMQSQSNQHQQSHPHAHPHLSHHPHHQNQMVMQQAPQMANLGPNLLGGHQQVGPPPPVLQW